MEINLTNIYKKYKGMWIALHEFKVISSGKDAKKVYSDAIKKGYKKPALFKVPTKNVAYVG